MTPNTLWSRIVRKWAALRDRPKLRASALFDPAWYLASNPDLGVNLDPALHYLAHGAHEGRDPGPGFSTSGYRLQGWEPAQRNGTDNPLLDHQRHPRRFAPLPVFAGNARAPATAPVVLFCAHQAGHLQFGAERSFLTMLEHAAEVGLAVEVVLPHCHDPAYLASVRARARAVRIIPYGWRRAGLSPHPATLAALGAAIRDTGAVELHQNTLVCDAPLRAARQAGIEAVVHLRELPAQDPELCARLGQSADALRTELVSQADRFIANSAAMAQWMDPTQHLGKRVCVLPNRVDPALFDLPFQPRTPLRVGLVSSNTAKKGIAHARDLAQACAQENLAVEIVLIGPSSPDLEALGPLPPNMRHLGFAPGPKAAMTGLDVVLSLSQFAESFGRTVLEAMAAGRPVIAYDRGAPPSLIGASAGWVVPADDVGAVRDVLRQLVAQPDTLEQASLAARAQARGILAQAEAVPAHDLYATALRGSRDADA
jgi:glycosyltransferase involved in cell wall biosynthesis